MSDCMFKQVKIRTTWIYFPLKRISIDIELRNGSLKGISANEHVLLSLEHFTEIVEYEEEAFVLVGPNENICFLEFLLLESNCRFFIEKRSVNYRGEYSDSQSDSDPIPFFIHHFCRIGFPQTVNRGSNIFPENTQTMMERRERFGEYRLSSDGGFYRKWDLIEKDSDSTFRGDTS